jgi:hypothetical protein
VVYQVPFFRCHIPLRLSRCKITTAGELFGAAAVLSGGTPLPRRKEPAINATSTPTLGDHLLNEIPPPVLFNTWKHHAGALRGRIREFASRGESGLCDLAGRLIVLGTELMDLYTGAFTPEQIAAKVVALLRAEGRLERAAYAAWVEGSGGYAVLELPEDGSRWVLRQGEEGERYVHLHPARWAPQTRRVRANVLKTAVMALAYAAARGGDPLDVRLVNAVRTTYLGLSKVRAVADDLGLGTVVEALRKAGG